MKKSKFNIELNDQSSELEIARTIDFIRENAEHKESLIALLSERHPIYKERGTNQTARIKGYMLASFGKIGLPKRALTFVLEELENGRDAYKLAGAARALRGGKEPSAHFASYLLLGVQNIRLHDDSMSLDTFYPSWPLEDPTSALKEIFKSFQWLRGYAKAVIPELEKLATNEVDFDELTRLQIVAAINEIKADKRDLNLSCCDDIPLQKNGHKAWLNGRSGGRSIKNINVENQDGKLTKLNNVLERKTTIVAFFYTRCMNPNKCTLTINKLAQLQQELAAERLADRVKIIAFTYDPEHDLPEKMRAFGENRGVRFNENMQMLRAQDKEGMRRITEYFRLGVNYTGATVNEHRIELFLLNDKGAVKQSFLRLQWEQNSVVNAVKKQLRRNRRRTFLSPFLMFLKNFVFPIVIVFFPKCPVCWAAYLSVFGISSLEAIPYSPWIVPVLIAAIGINLLILFRNASSRNGMFPFYISLTGAILVLFSGYLFSSNLGAITGIICMVSGSLLNSLPFNLYVKLIGYLGRLKYRLRLN